MLHFWAVPLGVVLRNQIQISWMCYNYRSVTRKLKYLLDVNDHQLTVVMQHPVAV